MIIMPHIARLSRLKNRKIPQLTHCMRKYAICASSSLACLSGIFFFTYAAELALHFIWLSAGPFDGKHPHKPFEFHQVHDAKERTSLSHDEFQIRSDDVRPLRRNRANGRVIDPQ